MKLTKILAIPLMVAMLWIAGFASLAEAQVIAPRVAIQLLTTGLASPLVASSSDATVARLVLDTTASTEPVNINALPFILTTGSGALSSTLRNCRVFNELNPTVALNTSATSTTMVSGLNNIVLNTPLVLGANTITTLALRCDVGTDLVSGGTYTFSMNTSDFVAVGTATGLRAIVTVRGAVVVPPVVPPAVPGFPATGSEGEAPMNFAIIFSTLALAGAGLVMAKRIEKKV